MDKNSNNKKNTKWGSIDNNQSLFNTKQKSNYYAQIFFFVFLKTTTEITKLEF